LELAKRAIDLDCGDAAGRSFESLAQALLYQLRSEKNQS
jgi:hypothetical protein